jgi:acetyl-CoA acetyltransferase family protein
MNIAFSTATIPVRLAWSSPFARWQGPLADISALDLGADVTCRALAERGFDPASIDRLVLGITTPQLGGFYGAPTMAARIGAPGVSGPMIAQACATSAACIEAAALHSESSPDTIDLVLTTDRTSNSPLVVYPSSMAAGGEPGREHWFLDNIRRDPWAGKSMMETAERVAQQAGNTREEIDKLTLLRYDQYRTALADDRAFQRRFMVPVEVPGRRGAIEVGEDVGVHDTTAEGLAKLDPVIPGGVITYGSQTHPADGTAGLVVTGLDKARELADGGAIARILGSGFARVGRSEMPKAPVPAAHAALAAAGVDMEQVDAVTTHNPFAVNDLWFSRETGFSLERMNAHGSSLVYGHPHAPTGARLVVELIHTLVERGGGVGLFTGCAAGDTGAALVLRVED